MNRKDRILTTMFVVWWVSGAFLLLSAFYVYALAMANRATMLDMLVFVPGLALQFVVVFLAKRANCQKGLS